VCFFTKKSKNKNKFVFSMASRISTRVSTTPIAQTKTSNIDFEGGEELWGDNADTDLAAMLEEELSETKTTPVGSMPLLPITPILSLPSESPSGRGLAQTTPVLPSNRPPLSLPTTTLSRSSSEQQPLVSPNPVIYQREVNLNRPVRSLATSDLNKVYNAILQDPAIPKSVYKHALQLGYETQESIDYIIGWLQLLAGGPKLLEQIYCLCQLITRDAYPRLQKIAPFIAHNKREYCRYLGQDLFNIKFSENRQTLDKLTADDLQNIEDYKIQTPKELPYCNKYNRIGTKTAEQKLQDQKFPFARIVEPYLIRITDWLELDPQARGKILYNQPFVLESTFDRIGGKDIQWRQIRVREDLKKAYDEILNRELGEPISNIPWPPVRIDVSIQYIDKFKNIQNQDEIMLKVSDHVLSQIHRLHNLMRTSGAAVYLIRDTLSYNAEKNQLDMSFGVFASPSKEKKHSYSESKSLMGLVVQNRAEINQKIQEIFGKDAKVSNRMNAVGTDFYLSKPKLIMVPNSNQIILKYQMILGKPKS
jgi:hypothetical protein